LQTGSFGGGAYRPIACAELKTKEERISKGKEDWLAGAKFSSETKDNRQ